MYMKVIFSYHIFAHHTMACEYANYQKSIINYYFSGRNYYRNTYQILKMLFLANNGGGGGGGGRSGGSSSGGGLLSSFFAPKPDPVELAKEWKRKLAKEARAMEREINNIKRQEDRAVKECKALAKAGRLPAAKILAKEIVNTRKTIERMYMAKAQLNSVSNTLQTSVCKWMPFDLIFLPLTVYFSMSYICESHDQNERMHREERGNYGINE